MDCQGRVPEGDEQRLRALFKPGMTASLTGRVDCAIIPARHASPVWYQILDRIRSRTRGKAYAIVKSSN